jgi:hypothetical protein
MAADRSGVSQRKRPLPFGLQLLLAAGLILLILGIARQLTVVPARQELDAVRAIEKSGCHVEWRDPPDDEIETPFGTYRRSWFTWILGEKYFSHIVRVGIGRNVDKDLVDYLGRLRHYEEAIASLRGTEANDASAMYLAQISRLRVADLSLSRVTDLGVRELVAAADLEVLDLEHGDVTDQAVASLAAIPKLRELNLEGTHVSQEAVQRLKTAKPELAITGATAPSEAERAAAVDLGAIPAVAVRAMRCESGATAYAVALQWDRFWWRSHPQFPKGARTRAEVLRELRRLPHLVRLKLVGGSLDGYDLDDLAQLKTVRELYLLRGCSFIQRGVAEHIASLTNLRKLLLDRVAMSNRELELIGSLPQLESLYVDWPQEYWASTDDFYMHESLVAINDAGLECLRRMPRLRRLALRIDDPRRKSGLMHAPVYSVEAPEAEISDAGLAYIKTLPNLEFLDLSGTKVTPAGLLRLQGVAKLRELVIRGISIGATQEARLRQALPQTAIQTGPLDVTDSRIPSGQKSLAELLRVPDPIP